MQSDKKIFDVIHVLGNIAVKSHKNLTQEEEHVDANGVGHDFSQRLNLLPPRIEITYPANDQAQQNQQGRPGGKSR